MCCLLVTVESSILLAWSRGAVVVNTNYWVFSAVVCLMNCLCEIIAIASVAMFVLLFSVCQAQWE